MAQLSVRELREDLERLRKKIRKYLIPKFSYNFERPTALNRKTFANRALVTIAATLPIPMSNILVTIQTLSQSNYARDHARGRA